MITKTKQQEVVNYVMRPFTLNSHKRIEIPFNCYLCAALKYTGFGVVIYSIFLKQVTLRLCIMAILICEQVEWLSVHHERS